MSDWKYLAEQLVAARVRMGYRFRSEFVRAKGIGHDRVLNDLENANRTTYSPSTLASAEQWYGLAPGNIKELLDGMPPRYADDSQGADADSGVLLDLPKDALAGLGVLEQEEVRASAVAAALKKIREIRAAEN